MSRLLVASLALFTLLSVSMHEASLFAIDSVVKAQFPNGGWGQGYDSFPKHGSRMANSAITARPIQLGESSTAAPSFATSERSAGTWPLCKGFDLIAWPFAVSRMPMAVDPLFVSHKVVITAIGVRPDVWNVSFHAN